MGFILHLAMEGKTELWDVQANYKNITFELVMIHLIVCEPCQKKQSMPRKALVVKPV